MQRRGVTLIEVRAATPTPPTRGVGVILPTVLRVSLHLGLLVPTSSSHENRPPRRGDLTLGALHRRLLRNRVGNGAPFDLVKRSSVLRGSLWGLSGLWGVISVSSVFQRWVYLFGNGGSEL